IILPVLKGWNLTFDILTTPTVGIILFAALFGTTSYLFYYKAINTIGPSKAMALNITYSAWAIAFGYLLLRETLELKDIIAAVVIVIGSVIAGGDIKELLSTKSKQKNKVF